MEVPNEPLICPPLLSCYLCIILVSERDCLVRRHVHISAMTGGFEIIGTVTTMLAAYNGTITLYEKRCGDAKGKTSSEG
jgi:hypothetical protein